MNEGSLVSCSLKVVSWTDLEHNFKGIVLSIVDVLLNLSELHEVFISPALSHIEFALELSGEVSGRIALVDQSKPVFLTSGGDWSAHELKEDGEITIFVF